MESVFFEFDLDGFWEESEYATTAYVSLPPTPELILAIEQELGYKLPASYLELMKHQNGGIPKRCAFPTQQETSWATDHVALTGCWGLAEKKPIRCAEV